MAAPTSPPSFTTRPLRVRYVSIPTSNSRRGSPAGGCASWHWALAKAIRLLFICRWCPKRLSPCWPVPGSEPFIRWFLVALPRLNWPSASTMSPKGVLSASCGIEFDRVIPYKPLLDEALGLATHQPDHCLILQRPQCQADPATEPDLDWATAADSRPNPPTVCRYGLPTRCIFLHLRYNRQTQRHCARQWRACRCLTYSLKAIYDVNPGDVFWAASDLGWAVGHSYIVYGPLL